MQGQHDLLIDKLIERLQYDDPIVRRNAAGALRLHGQRARGSVAALEKLLDDPAPMVRAEAQRDAGGETDRGTTSWPARSPVGRAAQVELS